MGRANLPGYEPLHEAPALILLCAPEARFSEINCSLAAENALIAATDAGLGSNILHTPLLAFESDDTLQAKLDVPIGHKPVASVIIGYRRPEQEDHPHGRRNTRITYI